MYKIKVIVGSVRERRFGEKVLPWLLSNLEKQNTEREFEVEVLDLKDFNLPVFSEGVSPMFIKNFEYRLDEVKKWSAKVNDGDAYIFLAPEYNHGVSSALKNAMDYLFSEWQFKPFGIVSYGEVGGANMIQMLRLIAIELRMIPVKQAVHIMDPWTLKDENGNLRDGVLEKYTGQLETLMKDLLFICGKMR